NRSAHAASIQERQLRLAIDTPRLPPDLQSHRRLQAFRCARHRSPIIANAMPTDNLGAREIRKNPAPEKLLASEDIDPRTAARGSSATNGLLDFDAGTGVFEFLLDLQIGRASCRESVYPFELAVS